MNGCQPLLRLKHAVIVAIGVGFIHVAAAVGLGPIHVDSYLGQPLDASIKVSGLSSASAERTSVKLASMTDYQSRGIEKLPTHDKLRFNVVKGGSGYVIDVHSSAGIREPFVNFLLTMTSDGVNVTREYAVFLNPDPAQTAGITSNPAPEMPAEAPLAVLETPVNGTNSASLIPSNDNETKHLLQLDPNLSNTFQSAPVATLATQQSISLAASPKTQSEQSPLLATPKPESDSQSVAEKQSQPVAVSLQPASAETTGWGGGKLEGAVPISLSPPQSSEMENTQVAGVGSRVYGPVKPGETLYSIALNTRPSESVSVNKMMRAIYRANRSAFSSRNMNSLMAGYQLTIPDLNTVVATSARPPKPVNATPATAKPIATNTNDATANLSATNNDAEFAQNNKDEEGSAENTGLADSVADASTDIPSSDDDLDVDSQALAQETTASVDQPMAPSATAEIANANQQLDAMGQADAETDETPANDQELVAQADDSQPLLSSDLTLDSADSFSPLAQENGNDSAEDMGTSQTEETATVEQASNDARAEPEANEVLSATDQPSVSNEQPLRVDNKHTQPGTEAETTLGADANSALNSTDGVEDGSNGSNTPPPVESRPAQDTGEDGMILPKWMLGLLAALVALLALLILIFLRRRSQPQDGMSDEEIADMIAELEEDEKLKHSLNFHELTEDPTNDDTIEDISATYDIHESAHESSRVAHPSSSINDAQIDDDFDKLSAEAAKLGQLGEDDFAAKHPLTSTDDQFDLNASHSLQDEDLSQVRHNKHIVIGIDDVEHANDEDAQKQHQQDDDVSDLTSIETTTSDGETEEHGLPEFDFSLEDEKRASTADDIVTHPHQEKISVRDESENDNNVQPTMSANEINEAMEINLDLANAFIVTGNGERARVWLDEVLELGNDAQKAKAQTLLKQISQS